MALPTQQHSLPQQAQQPLQALRTYLDQHSRHMADAIPQQLRAICTPARMAKVAMMAAAQPRSLLPQCTSLSILKALTDLAALGLEPGTGPTALAYLVPYRNGSQWEAQPMIGYRGYLALARRSGLFQDIHATVVHAKDTFEIHLGSQPYVRHLPYLGSDDPGEIIGAYCVTRLVGGGEQIDFMRRGEIERIRDKHSKSARSGNSPWATDFAAMAVKTIVRRAAKHWPLSAEIRDAVALDTVAETVDAMDPLVVVAAPVNTEADEAPSELAAAQAEARALLNPHSTPAQTKPAPEEPAPRND